MASYRREDIREPTAVLQRRPPPPPPPADAPPSLPPTPQSTSSPLPDQLHPLASEGNRPTCLQIQTNRNQDETSAKVQLLPPTPVSALDTVPSDGQIYRITDPVTKLPVFVTLERLVQKEILAKRYQHTIEGSRFELEDTRKACRILTKEAEEARAREMRAQGLRLEVERDDGTVVRELQARLATMETEKREMVEALQSQVMRLENEGKEKDKKRAEEDTVAQEDAVKMNIWRRKMETQGEELKLALQERDARLKEMERVVQNDKDRIHQLEQQVANLVKENDQLEQEKEAEMEKYASDRAIWTSTPTTAHATIFQLQDALASSKQETIKWQAEVARLRDVVRAKDDKINDSIRRIRILKLENQQAGATIAPAAAGSMAAWRPGPEFAPFQTSLSRTAPSQVPGPSDSLPHPGATIGCASMIAWQPRPDSAPCQTNLDRSASSQALAPPASVPDPAPAEDEVDMEIDTDDMSDHETILPPAQYQVPPAVPGTFAPAANTPIESADGDVENEDEDTVVFLSQSDMTITELEGRIRKLQNRFAISQKEKERVVAEQKLSDLDKDKAREEVDRLEKEVSDLRDEASKQKTRITALVGELNRRRCLDDMKLFNRRITRVEARRPTDTNQFQPLSKDTEEALLGLGTDTTNGRLSLLGSNANLFEELFAELADLVRYVREVSMAKCEEGRLADRELQSAGRQVVKWTDWLEELIADAREVYEKVTG